MKNDLKILITANLNIGKSIGEINTAIKGLQKKVNSLKINVHIDDKVAKTLADYSKAMENHKKINQDLNRVMKEEKVITKENGNVIKENITQQTKNGEIIQKEIIRRDNRTKAVKKENEEIRKQISEIEKLGQIQKKVSVTDGNKNLKSQSQTYKNGNTTTTYNSNNKGEVTSIKNTQNLEQERKATESLNASKLKLKSSLKGLYDQAKITDNQFKGFGKNIDATKSLKEIEKIKNALNNVAQQNNNASQQNKLLSQATSLLNSSAKGTDKQAINAIITNLNRIKPSATNAANSLKLIDNQLRSITRSSNEANRASLSLVDSFRTAMVKFPVLNAICAGVKLL